MTSKYQLLIFDMGGTLVKNTKLYDKIRCQFLYRTVKEKVTQKIIRDFEEYFHELRESIRSHEKRMFEFAIALPSGQFIILHRRSRRSRHRYHSSRRTDRRISLPKRAGQILPKSGVLHKQEHHRQGYRRQVHHSRGSLRMYRWDLLSCPSPTVP